MKVLASISILGFGTVGTSVGNGFLKLDIAIIAIYVFREKIYDDIEKVKPDADGEIQLTDDIQQLIDEDCSVYAIELDPNERRIDIGTPKSYWTALNATKKIRNVASKCARINNSSYRARIRLFW